MLSDRGLCDVEVMQSTGQVECGIHFNGCTTAALFVGEHSPVPLCRFHMPVLYVKQRCDRDHYLLSSTLALSKSILFNVAEPFGPLCPERCKLYVERKEMQGG